METEREREGKIRQIDPGTMTRRESTNRKLKLKKPFSLSLFQIKNGKEKIASESEEKNLQDGRI